MFKDAESFYQNISTWCVINIESKPTDFDKGAGFEAESEMQPQWGTCPRIHKVNMTPVYYLLLN